MVALGELVDSWRHSLTSQIASRRSLTRLRTCELDVKQNGLPLVLVMGVTIHERQEEVPVPDEKEAYGDVTAYESAMVSWRVDNSHCQPGRQAKWVPKFLSSPESAAVGCSARPDQPCSARRSPCGASRPVSATVGGTRAASGARARIQAAASGRSPCSPYPRPRRRRLAGHGRGCGRGFC